MAPERNPVRRRLRDRQGGQHAFYQLQDQPSRYKLGCMAASNDFLTALQLGCGQSPKQCSQRDHQYCQCRFQPSEARQATLRSDEFPQRSTSTAKPRFQIDGGGKKMTG